MHGPLKYHLRHLLLTMRFSLKQSHPIIVLKFRQSAPQSYLLVKAMCNRSTRTTILSSTSIQTLIMSISAGYRLFPTQRLVLILMSRCYLRFNYNDTLLFFFHSSSLSSMLRLATFSAILSTLMLFHAASICSSRRRFSSLSATMSKPLSFIIKRA